MRTRIRVLLAVALLLAAAVAALALYAPPAANQPVNTGGIEVDSAKLDVRIDYDDLSASVVPTPTALQISAPSKPIDLTLTDTPAVTADMSVNEMLELLGDRARRGDAVAACELGRALLECRMQPLMVNGGPPPPPQGADRESVDRFIEYEARREEWRTQLQQRCDGLSRPTLSEGLAFSARAALAGHTPSLLDFLNGPMMSPAEFIRDPQLGHVYRTQAWPLVRRALAERNYLVASVVFRQLAMMPVGPLSAIVPDQYQDPDAARALHEMLSGQAPPTVRAAPSSAEALAVAERWADELFAGQLPEGTTRVNVSEMPMPGDFGARCRDPATWIDLTRL
jgi:hypothetical protein